MLRTLLFLSLFILIGLLPGKLIASEYLTSDEPYKKGFNFKPEADYQKNIIKIAPLKLLFGGVNLSYERILTSHSSVNIRTIYRPMGYLERWIGDFSTSGNNYSFGLKDHPHFYSVNVDAEYRFYIKNKKPSQGFYIAPYARYINYTGKYESIYNGYIANQPIEIDGQLRTAFNIWGAGAQLGAQWIIMDKFSIDWSFAGIGIDHYNFTVGVESDNLYNTVDQYTHDLKNVLGGISTFLAKKLAFNALDNEIHSSVPFWMVGFKSSLTIGLYF